MNRDLAAAAEHVWHAYVASLNDRGYDQQRPKLMLDQSSYRLFVRDLCIYTEYDGLVYRPMWRGLQPTPIHVGPPIPELASDETPSTIYARADEPFCMYIEVQKANGRVVYFDHPDTDKRYL